MLYNTGGTWDNVVGSSGVVELSSALAAVYGSSDTVYFVGGKGNAVSLNNSAGTWDNVVGSSGVVELNSAAAAVYGGSETVYFQGGTGNAAALYNTAGTWDNVVGSGGVAELSSALAAVYGNSDTVYFQGGANTATASGTAEAFVFQPAIGVNTIGGFGSTDSMTFSSSDFANWSALLSHTSQVGSNTVITLDATDKVTLTGVTATSLQQSQFHFS